MKRLRSIRVRSIRVRLLGLIGLLLLMAIASFGYLAWYRGSAVRITAIDSELAVRMDLLLKGYRPESGQRPDEVTAPRFSDRTRELFANRGGVPFYYRVWTPAGKVQGRSEAAPEVVPPSRTREGDSARRRGHFRELIYFTPTGRCFLVGRSMERELAVMRNDALSLTLAGAGILLFGLALAWWIASYVTRPLAQISRTAQRIAAGELSERIPLADTEDELGDVVNVLNQTFARLESAFERQKQFTSDASHELRTPVSLILAHAQGALLHEQSPEEYREALNDCEQAAQRMKKLIESLLDLARFDADAEPMHREQCDLAALTRECLQILHPLTAAKGIRINPKLQPAPCQAHCARLTQVIINLLTNAIQVTPTGGTITLRTHHDGQAHFVVSDSGSGISPEHLPHIFERFYRADASRARSTGGTGLGLAICKSIVEAHGGTIMVESQISQGSTFTILLDKQNA